MRAVIPIAAPGPLARAASWTWVLRIALGLALAGLLAAAFVSARAPKSGSALLADGRSPVVALDLSWSVSSRNAKLVGRALDDLAVSGQKLGLVLFSDSAYEAFPPGTSSTALRPFLRFFDRGNGTNPWRATFSAGTRIGAALDRAREMLRAANIDNGSVVLISDLDDSPADEPDLARTLVGFQRDGIPIHMIAINAVPEDVRYFRAALGPGGGTVTTLGSNAPKRLDTAGASFPTALTVAIGLLLLLLAANELLLGRLSWGRTS